MIQSASSNPSEMYGSIVLIAGETPMIRDNVQVPLQHHQIRVIVTSDVIHARSLIVKEAPALVLINEELPDRDGYQVCLRLRQDLPPQALPILLLQNKKDTVDPNQPLRVRLAGATASLTLPMDANELVQAVKKYLSKGI
jgi:DNA-binding response OmpR family regulator